MGCASSRVMHLQAERDDSQSPPRIPDTPRRSRKRMRVEEEEAQHIVALTSSTYGVLDTKTVEQINTQELMKGLEEDKHSRLLSPCKHRRSLSVSAVHAARMVQEILNNKEAAAGLHLLLKDMHSSNMGGDMKQDFYNVSPDAHPSSSSTTTGVSSHSNKKQKRCESSNASNCLPVSSSESSAVFDPELLESIEKAFEQMSEKEWNALRDPAPPGGEESVVVYFTSLRGIRRTHEECTQVMGILRGYGVCVDERDVSMHQAFKEELKGMGKQGLPTVFIKGRYIGGVEEVCRVHERGDLRGLLEGIRREESGICEGCGGARFVVCMDCNGSCKVRTEDGIGRSKCVECNENGLIRCPICC